MLPAWCRQRDLLSFLCYISWYTFLTRCKLEQNGDLVTGFFFLILRDQGVANIAIHLTSKRGEKKETSFKHGQRGFWSTKSERPLSWTHSIKKTYQDTTFRFYTLYSDTVLSRYRFTGPTTERANSQTDEDNDSSDDYRWLSQTLFRDKPPGFKPSRLHRNAD